MGNDSNAFACFVVSCSLARWRYYSIKISKQSLFRAYYKLNSIITFCIVYNEGFNLGH